MEYLRKSYSKTMRKISLNLLQTKMVYKLCSQTTMLMKLVRKAETKIIYPKSEIKNKHKT